MARADGTGGRRGYRTGMRFEIIDDSTPLGAPIEQVAQHAADAASTRYTADGGTDVEHALQEELHSRGLRAVDTDWVAAAARAIRSGHGADIARGTGAP